MRILQTYRALKQIALDEFEDIVVGAEIVALPTGDPMKLRLDIADGSLLDVYISISGRYSYHWERRFLAGGGIYRHDNAPHDRRRSAPRSPGISTMAASRMWWRAISATTLKRRSGSSSRSFVRSCCRRGRESSPCHGLSGTSPVLQLTPAVAALAGHIGPREWGRG